MMIPSLNSWNCEFSPPSLQAWTYAVSVHGVCCILGALPLGSILFYTTTNWNSNRYRRRIVAVIIAVYAALIVPVTQSAIESYAPNEKIRFAGSFLSSTFGFSTFFKSINAGFDQYPIGVDTDITTWLLWYINLPEPEFTKGKMCLASKSYVWNKIKLTSCKVAGMFVVLTVLKILGEEAEEDHKGWWFVMMNVNGFLHLWLLYLFASFCLDFSSLAGIATSGGYRTEPGFLNPLLESRSYKETWGTRWNCPVQLLLKRTVYIPARKYGFSGSTSAFLTFFASGLLHEYNFSIHNRHSWEPYKATFFFLLMGMMMILEKYVWTTFVPSQLQHAADHLPSSVISVVLTALVSGVFEYYFAQSWVKSGWIDSVSEMLPSLSCKL